MRQVRMLRGWNGPRGARFGTGDVATFSDEEAAVIVAAEAGVYASGSPEGTAAMMAPPQDKMGKASGKMKGTR